MAVPPGVRAVRGGRGASRIPPIVVAGVTGSGKSTIGRLLADRLRLPFLDADDLHSAANRAKLHAGEPLDDADRAPWLDRVGAAIAAAGTNVVACSALKLAYRDRLREYAPDLVIVQLDVPVEELERRLAARRGHFAAPSLLPSQLATLEPLLARERGFVMPAAGDPAATVDAILARGTMGA